jgi:hypothetical protein
VELTRRTSDVRRIGAIAFGVLLWLQLAASALSREISFDADPRRIAVYALPLLLLPLVALVRNPIVSLLFFPTSFGGVLVVVPRAALDELADPVVFVFVVLALLGYVLAVSAWLQEGRNEEYVVRTARPAQPRRDRWRPYRGWFAPRAVVLVAAFVVMAGAIPLRAELIARIAEGFGSQSDPDAAAQGVILCNLAMFFAWAVMAYALFFVPAIEMEKRVRNLETRMQATLARTRSPGRRTLLLAGLIVATTLALLLLRRLW